MNVNGYYCKNCADVELAKHGMNPAKPNHEFAGNEVYVPPPADDPKKLGVNRPTPGAATGGRLDVRA